ncbi:MAG: hypothetical protein CM1200mP5_4570 [Candidatus Pelagibacterales bacterium]|nr:MAG: hypothetical protein CM1200mP5_4570 [Pelagibacterales bacterium]
MNPIMVKKELPGYLLIVTRSIWREAYILLRGVLHH